MKMNILASRIATFSFTSSILDGKSFLNDKPTISTAGSSSTSVNSNVAIIA